MEAFKPGEVVAVMQCDRVARHIFHWKCLREQLYRNFSCPMCRSDTERHFNEKLLMRLPTEVAVVDLTVEEDESVDSS